MRPDLRIGPLLIEPPLLLAPMAGVTDSAFRRVVREIEPGGLIFSEMVAAEGLSRRQPNSLRILRHHPAEHPLAFQLFGARPASMARAAELVQEFEPRLLDINMGCPARKVRRSGSGVALLGSPAQALEVVRAVLRVAAVPVTVKLRRGDPGGEADTLELARRFAGEGIAALTVHGRGLAHSYADPADWEFIARAAAALPIPVIGNGDLDSPEMAERRLAESGCAGVMVGRAVIGDPWLFARMAARLAGRPVPPRPGPGERAAVLLRHLELMFEGMGAHACQHSRMFLPAYTRGLPGAAQLRQAWFRARTRAELETLVREFFGALDLRSSPPGAALR